MLRAPYRLALLPLLLAAAPPIDREALVRRHNPVLTAIDPHAPAMIGNGEIGFAADITGLQTFPERYAPLAPLLTMAQWAWHSFPNDRGYKEADGLQMIPVEGRGVQPYAYMGGLNYAGAPPAFTWLRANPHRISLGRLQLADARTGRPIDFADVSATRQTLDMWTGTLTSNFRWRGAPVTVTTRVLPDRDAVAVELRAPQSARAGLAVAVRYPGVAPAINPDPSSWVPRAGETLRVTQRTTHSWRIERRLDATRYWSQISSDGSIAQAPGDRFVVRATGGDRLSVVVTFDRTASAAAPVPARDASRVADRWRRFWTGGAAIDFAGSTDPRAAELERRVVLSQYLSAINGAGSLPPQEEGLFSNSWYGKFHVEMHPWHSAWQALWGHPDLLERSLGWYVRILPQARAEAARHRVKGAWWPKMVGPEARNSPSLVSPFLMWQQPHPILMAELVWRARRDPAVLGRYGQMVEATADLLASWPLDHDGRLDLGPPIIPAQENYDPLVTRNPTFELEYFRWALNVAQQWRERQGLARRTDWDGAISRLARPTVRDGVYLPAASVPDFWKVAATDACRRHADAPACANRDHPSFLMAYGFIPGGRVDLETMRRTLRLVEANWDMRQTWGWDYPMIAMTAARLGEPERAVDALFANVGNNRWGITGMTPRVHADAQAALVPVGGGAAGVAGGDNPDGPGFVRAADTYFPANGALLMAVGMMAGGWDGAKGPAPGFPRKGWSVRAVGFTPAP